MLPGGLRRIVNFQPGGAARTAREAATRSKVQREVEFSGLESRFVLQIQPYVRHQPRLGQTERKTELFSCKKVMV